jgi:hypothetical protein
MQLHLFFSTLGAGPPTLCRHPPEFNVWGGCRFDRRVAQYKVLTQYQVVEIDHERNVIQLEALLCSPSASPTRLSLKLVRLIEK